MSTAPLKKWLHPPQFLAAFILTCLVIAPHQAVAQTPTPGGSAATLAETKDILQTFGVVTVALFVLLVGTVVLSLLAAWKIVLPLIQANSSANQQIALMNQQTLQAQTGYLGALQSVSDSVGKAASILKDVETAKNAELRAAEIQANSDKNTSAINTHTDEALKPLVETVSQNVLKLEVISNQMKTLATTDHVDGEFKKLTDRLDQVIADLKPKTGPLDAVKVPDAPPALAKKEGD